MLFARTAADNVALFSALPAPAFAVTRAGVVVAWNGEAERSFGWTAAEALGRELRVVAGRSRATFLASVAWILSRGDDAPGVVELSCALRDGTSRRVRFRTARTGHGPGAAAVLLEVTDPDHRPPAAPDAAPSIRLGERVAVADRESRRLVSLDGRGREVPSPLPQRHALDAHPASPAGAARAAGLDEAALDATERRAAERELRARVAQQAALTRLAAGALDEEDPARLVARAVCLTVAAHGADAGGIAELGDGGRVVRPAAGVGPWPEPGAVPLERDPISSRVVAGGRPLLVDGSEAAPPLSAPLRAAGFASLAAVLVGPRDAPIGVLAVSSRQAGRFSADDVRSLEATAAVLAIALGRGRALRAARTTEETFRRLVESTPDLILFHREGRVLYANPALLALLGRPREVVLGSQIASWIHPDDRAVLEREPAPAPPPAAEIRLRRAGGRWTSADVLVLGTEVDGRPARVAIGRDLTERRHAEERLARAERLASLGTLAAGVAHELNNPLTFVVSNLEFVADHLGRAPPAPRDAEREEVLRALDEALEGAERMRGIVRDLRTLARTDAACDGAVDVRCVVEYASKLAAPEVRPRARLTWDVAPVPPVRGNEARLGQMLLNLVVNAAHAIPEGAPHENEIRITVRDEGGDHVAIAVSDTGAGIPPDVRARIFDPFFTTKSAGLGTGLGLWICNDIVSAHGGTIDVESTLGRGTTFRVRLPAAARPLPAPAGAARSGAAGRRVLVVDDEPLVVATVRRQLGRGYAVDAASGPTEALAWITASSGYDAIVSDVVMPGGGGLGLLEALRRAAPALAGRVIFMTGGVRRDDAERLHETGCPLLEKPFDGARLRAALRSVLA